MKILVILFFSLAPSKVDLIMKTITAIAAIIINVIRTILREASGHFEH